MLDRRKILTAALVFISFPIRGALAQPPPPFRPPMPPPRHELRPRRPPGTRPWRWSRGRWRWNGRRWVWTSGRWIWR
ncbi:MAG: YXWGXW repeat-containing protein [Alphaproteobacteria bacterium]|nr:YXWGXW repeat-containing protein [Alphaproteobacteria bacterium]